MARDAMLSGGIVTVSDQDSNSKATDTSSEASEAIPNKETQEKPKDDKETVTNSSKGKAATTSERKPRKQTSSSATNNEPEVVPVVQQQPPAYVPKRRKKERMTDTHTSKAYYVQNDIIELIEEIVGDDWGGKYRFVNDALKLYIHTFHKEHAHKIKDLP